MLLRVTSVLLQHVVCYLWPYAVIKAMCILSFLESYDYHGSVSELSAFGFQHMELAG